MLSLILEISLFLIAIIPASRSQILPANLNYELDAFTPTDDNLCDEQLLEVYTSLIAGELWALELVDTWAKIQSGLFEGNLFNMGRRKKCKAFRRKDEEDPSSPQIRGKHCLVGLEPLRGNSTGKEKGGMNLGMIGDALKQINQTVAHGVCLPASCSNKKIVKFLERFLNKAGVHAIGAQCNTDEHEPFSAVDFISASVLVILVLLLALSTAYDLRKRDSTFEPNRLLIAFSVYTNGQKLFKIHTGDSNTIRCLLGIRVLSIFCIIAAHRLYIEIIYVPLRNPAELWVTLERWFACILVGSEFAVDTFFLIGGLLVTLSQLRKFEKKQFFYPQFLLHRYLRYAPIAAATTLFVFPYIKLSNEHLLEREKQKCEEHWWANLLMFNNLQPGRMCAPHLWYLAVDFQLYAVSPLLVFCLWKFAWKAFWTLPTLITGSIIYVVHTCMHNAKNESTLFNLIYFPTHARLGPWIIGIMLGYILFRLRDEKCKIGIKLNFLFWSLSLICLWWPAYFSVLLKRQGDHVELLGNAIFMGAKRQIWALGVAWIIFACQNLKTGGVIRWFLSLNFWQPIARMTLSMYLVHVYYIQFLIIQREDIIDFEVWSILNSAFGDIMAMLPIGCLVCLTFEAPIYAIESYVMKRKTNNLEITSNERKEDIVNTRC